MKRIDLIHDALKNLDNGTGVTTTTISSHLGIERSNTSKDLNILVSKGLIFKNNTRPVKYFVNNPFKNTVQNLNEIDKFTKLYPSLKNSINLAKTAILYPPFGMNSIIIGETGVGKSMLAKLMHDYAQSLKSKEIPYIHFNCSDYSNNPQLLVSHLFGVKKGTFTGASSDKEGLIEKANNGIIFLDEIHNLPNEGQEMLFLYMDTGYFRRFGEVSEKRKSSALIICATNKDINSTLLDTFTRRIPIKIQLPSLSERDLEERLTLIELFIKNESEKLQEDIFISKKSMLALLAYSCPNNIGQLKNDITLSVANAYFQYIVHNKKQIKINSPDLPPHIQEVLSTTTLEKANKLLSHIDFEEHYLCYNSDTEILGIARLKYKHNILDEFSNGIINMLTSNKSSEEESLILGLNGYYELLRLHMSKFEFTLNPSAFETLIQKISEIDELKYLTKNENFITLLKAHIDMVYERIGLLNIDPTPLIDKAETLFNKEFKHTSLIFNNIEEIYNINLSSIERLALLSIIIYYSNSR